MKWHWLDPRLWFHLSWWKYLFEKKDPYESWFTVLWCRMRGHPYGVVWYNPGGMEPDMSCNGCGDDLG